MSNTESKLYYYLVYLKSKNDPKKLELHLMPFYSKEAAEQERINWDKKLGDRVAKSKILTRDLSKYDNEFWL